MYIKKSCFLCWSQMRIGTHVLPLVFPIFFELALNIDTPKLRVSQGGVYEFMVSSYQTLSFG